MTSKAAKLRAKRNSRGRPCKADVPRAESGRISRAKAGGDAPDKLAKVTRMKKFGISQDDAGQPEAGTVIGRLKLAGLISPEQYQAFVRYQMTRERYMLAIDAPDSLRTRRGGVMSVPSDETVEAVVAAWAKVCRAITDANIYERGNLLAALEFIVIKDQDFPHMYGDLRVVGNSLCRHYGIDLLRKSA